MTAWTAARMERERRPGALDWVLGAALMLALVGIWGVPAMVRTHGEYAAVGLGKHVVMRSVAPLEGHGARTWWSYLATFPFYLLTVWPKLLPVVALAAGGHDGALEAPEQWRLDETCLVTGIVLVFGIFSLSWTKLPHYTLPAFPFMALLLAAWWDSGRDCQYRWAAAGTAVAAMVAALVACPLARPLFCLPTAL